MDVGLVEQKMKGETESNPWKTKPPLYKMVAFHLRTCEMCRDHVAVGMRMKSADRVLQCSRVFALPPLLQL